MKKTNVASAKSAVKWLRFLPLIICFIVFSSSDILAQNFKSYEDAMMSVRMEMEQMQQDLPSASDSHNQMGNSDKQDFFSYRFYNAFVGKLAETQDVEQSLEFIEEAMGMNNNSWQSKLSPERAELLETAHESLVGLITE